MSEFLFGIFLFFNSVINPPPPLKFAVKIVKSTPLPTLAVIPSPSPSPQGYLQKKVQGVSSKVLKPPENPKRKSNSITVSSILDALNSYRNKSGVSSLTIDSKLQEYAKFRAESLTKLGNLDKHADFNKFMKEDGFSKVGFNSLAENQSRNFKGTAKELIENLYGKSPKHNENQLNSKYTHVGIGISGVFTNLVFGGN